MGTEITKQESPGSGITMSGSGAARLLGVSHDMVNRWVDMGVLKGYRTSERGWHRIYYSSIVNLRQHFADGGTVEEYLEKLRREPVIEVQ